MLEAVELGGPERLNPCKLRLLEDSVRVLKGLNLLVLTVVGNEGVLCSPYITDFHIPSKLRPQRGFRLERQPLSWVCLRHRGRVPPTIIGGRQQELGA